MPACGGAVRIRGDDKWEGSGTRHLLLCFLMSTVDKLYGVKGVSERGVEGLFL